MKNIPKSTAHPWHDVAQQIIKRTMERYRSAGLG